jgi:hypothetical protein
MLIKDDNSRMAMLSFMEGTPLLILTTYFAHKLQLTIE